MFADLSVHLFGLVICRGNLVPFEYTIEDIRKCERLAGVADGDG